MILPLINLLFKEFTLDKPNLQQVVILPGFLSGYRPIARFWNTETDGTMKPARIIFQRLNDFTGCRLGYGLPLRMPVLVP